MKRYLIVMSSVLAIVLFLSVSFTSIVFAQSAILSNIEIPTLKRLRDRLTDDEWWPGQNIALIILFILFMIDAITSGPNPI